jgi:hypothetical protein
MPKWVALLLAVAACGGSSTVDLPSKDGGADGQAPPVDGAAPPADAGAEAAACADLQAKMSDALVKTCATADECAVVPVYGCCAVYTGIRKDKAADFSAAQQAYMTACPDGRGCGCQDHTETGDLVPAVQPPPVIVATCDNGKCTAHVKP